MRRILTAWIGVAGLALAAGAGLAAEEPIKRPLKPAKSYRIGVLEPNMAIPHFVAQAYGFVDEAEKLGARVLLYDAGEHKNVAKQVSQMEDLIANKVDAICIVPGTTATAVAQIDQAIAAGIPVVNVNIMSDNPKAIGRIRSDDYELGRLQGEFIVKALKGQGNVVMIAGVSGNSAFIMRAKGFKEYVAKHPGIKVLSEQWTPNATDKGLKLMEDWSQAFPKIDAVYSGGDRLTIGAVQALLAQGKKPGQVIVTSRGLQRRHREARARGLDLGRHGAGARHHRPLGHPRGHPRAGEAADPRQALHADLRRHQGERRPGGHHRRAAAEGVAAADVR